MTPSTAKPTPALVLRTDGERIVSLGTAEDLRAACEALDCSDLGVDPAEDLSRLRSLVVDSLDLQEDVRSVIVSPDGPLCYMPLGALFPGHSVTLTPSATTHVLLMEEEREPGERVLALGDPDYKGASEGAMAAYRGGLKLADLPGTREAAELVRDEVLLGKEANEEALAKKLSTQERWRAVHLACHGLVDRERPAMSSLAITRTEESDGFLTGIEILRMEIPADLAVLSACETARGKVVAGEGILGLTRAFMYAGTPRVLCSLWKVDDEATMAMMVKFYELWNPTEGEGIPTAAALEQAQEFIRNHEKWKHPYYWAAWVLWGLPN